jgi:hypothetical protein
VSVKLQASSAQRSTFNGDHSLMVTFNDRLELLADWPNQRYSPSLVGLPTVFPELPPKTSVLALALALACLSYTPGRSSQVNRLRLEGAADVCLLI